MDTLTPNLLRVETKSINGKFAGRGMAHPVYAESIVLFVGHSPHDMPESNEQFSYIVAENVDDAKKTIQHMQHILKKVPAVIIYRFESGFESALVEWESYFSTHQFLNTIPFFMYVDTVMEPLKSLIAKHNFIDDIISRDSWKALGSRIAIVSKIKRMRIFSPNKDIVRNNKPYTRKHYSTFLKRSLDIVLAGSGLLVLSPLLLVTAALIRLESKGPIFYAAKRAGKNYQVFKFYKFRTMVPDADKQLQKLKHLNQYEGKEGSPVFYKVANDPRITKLGSFLRNTSLDEIPQLYNVLKGDMSLVGNRPLPLYEATTLTTDEWVERFLAPAGITGLWQVSKRGKKEMSVEERIDLDIDYAHKHSFRYDMWLMVNTPLALVQKDNV